MIGRLLPAPVRSAGAIAVLSLTIAAALVALAFIARSREDAPRRAVIIDQLALTDPNPAFIDAARSQLSAAGYAIDVVAQDDVTVSYYAGLAQRGYDLIIVRSHIADRSYSLDQATRSVAVEDHARLFTNEPYDATKHVNDQLSSRLTIGTYPQRESAGRFFAIDPAFITNSMRGRFDGTTVLLMGCSGLRGSELADAFIARGASVLIGWDQPVTAAHTDQATEGLLAHLLAGRLEPRLAVAQTTIEFGPDPDYGGRLVVYP